tara:strand:+ start:1766 stop:2137 length:372 start_codon:yes stop_codon:yes gene_type:complete
MGIDMDSFYTEQELMDYFNQGQLFEVSTENDMTFDFWGCINRTQYICAYTKEPLENVEDVDIDDYRENRHYVRDFSRIEKWDIEQIRSFQNDRYTCLAICEDVEDPTCHFWVAYLEDTGGEDE